MLGNLSASGSTQSYGYELMVHVPCAEVAVAGFLVAFFAGESEPLAVAKRMLVDVRLAVGQVLDVLYCRTAEVSNPTGTADIPISHVLHHLSL